MNFEPYDVEISPDFVEYEFFSQGPRGSIKKIVRYTQAFVDTNMYFNLGFGDWNENENKIDDLVTSNNKDAEKVLATVAYTVIRFTGYYPTAIICVQGSTASRTRLYQMGINKFRNQIEKEFYIYGFINDEGWYSFELDKYYSAFLISRKNQYFYNIQKLFYG